MINTGYSTKWTHACTLYHVQTIPIPNLNTELHEKDFLLTNPHRNLSKSVVSFAATDILSALATILVMIS